MIPLFTLALLLAPAYSVQFLKAKDGLIKLDLEAVHSNQAPHKLTQLTTRAQAQTGKKEITLANYANQRFFIALQVGSPPQKLKCMIDTGSPNIWIQSNRMLKKQGDREMCVANNLFDPEASSTFLETKKSARPRGNFASNKAYHGPLAIDNMKIGFGDPTRSVDIQGGHFGLIEKANEGFGPKGDYDCVLGLAWPGWAVEPKSVSDGYKQKSTLEMVIGQLPKKMFSLYLSANSEDRSKLTFGGVDPALYQGEMFFLKAHKHDQWNVRLNDIKINGKSINLLEGKDWDKKPQLLAINSGSQKLTLPKEVYKRLQVQGLLKTVYGCNDASKFGTLTYVLEGGQELTLDSSYWMGVYTDVRAKGDTQCQPHIDIMDIEIAGGQGATFVAGMPLMLRYVTAFNVEKNEIGFAKSLLSGEGEFGTTDFKTGQPS